MSFDLVFPPFRPVGQAKRTADSGYPRFCHVTALSDCEVTDRCDQAFLALDTETPALGALQRYQDLADEAAHRQLTQMEFRGQLRLVMIGETDASHAE